MKFKNYINPYTKNNRIYSDKDIFDMSVGNVFKKSKEILGQKRTIGIPKVNELKVSSNTIWIDEYTRDDGTRVCGHWRSKPERERINEFEPPKKNRKDYDSDGMSLSGGEVVEALKTVIGGGMEKVKEFGKLLVNLFDKVDIEVLKSLPDNLKELYLNLADRIGSGTMTGAAANVLEKMEETSDVVLEGGVEFVDYLSSSGEVLKQIADEIRLPEVNANVVKKVLNAASEVGKGLETVDASDKLVEIKPSVLSNIRLKQKVKISKFKEALIKLNNDQNINYKDAMQCMNMALIGPENIENNVNFNILSQDEVSDLSKQMRFHIPENVKTVLYSSNSTLAKAVENSFCFKEAVKSWVSTPTEYRPDKILLELNDSENLSRSILHATILKPQVSNGYFRGYLYDLYDFRLQIINNDKIMQANTGAVILQYLQQLKNYNIIIPIKLKL